MYFLRYYNQTEPLRSLILLDTKSGLPPDEYIFMENFCGDKTCDCRKVMINVASKSQRKILATISYGWEPMSFYTEWLHGDKDLAEEMKGPSLELGGVQSEYAKRLLGYFKKYTGDDIYNKRLEKHYVDFKTRLKTIGRNDDCICGSAKKWKNCCMNFAISF